MLELRFVTPLSLSLVLAACGGSDSLDGQFLSGTTFTFAGGTPSTVIFPDATWSLQPVGESGQVQLDASGNTTAIEADTNVSYSFSCALLGSGTGARATLSGGQCSVSVIRSPNDGSEQTVINHDLTVTTGTAEVAGDNLALSLSGKDLEIDTNPGGDQTTKDITFSATVAGQREATE
jgi:hypothetical protein